MHEMSTEEFFMVGSANTTPDIFDVCGECPRPKYFYRMFIISLLLYGIVEFGWHAFKMPCFIPPIIFFGSFAVPLSMLVLFFEMNIHRNVTLFSLIRFTAFGGMAALILSICLLYFDEKVFSRLCISPDFYDCARAPVEEISKMLLLLILVFKARYRYRINGLLLGAAVGVGFASFESAGYALCNCLSTIFNEDIVSILARKQTTCSAILEVAVDQAENTILERGLLSPFAHIVWSAIVGGGIWWAKGYKRFTFRVLTDWRLGLSLCIAVALHIAWNLPYQLPFYLKYVICGILAWGVIINHYRAGLAQLKHEQRILLGKMF